MAGANHFCPYDSWFCTWFGFPENYEEHIMENMPDYKYICFCSDRCPRTEKLHKHIYVQFQKNQRMTSKKVQKLFPDSHWEHAKNPEACIKYIKGQDTTDRERDYKYDFEEFGELTKVVGQGKRSDLDRIGDEIKAGVSIEQIAWEHTAQFIRYGNRFRDTQRTLSKPRTSASEIIVMKIPDRANPKALIKHDLIIRDNPTYYIHESHAGYRQQEILYIIDNDAYDTFIDLCQSAVVDLPFKYEGVEFNTPKIVILTSNPGQYKISPENFQKI